jgi:hypothetical protein
LLNMKYYSCSSVFKFSWDQVATAVWSRYPNPYSTHVLTEDTICQSTINGQLHSKRLLTKTNHLPRWGERFVPGPRNVCVLEESVVDPKSKTVTTYTRNIGYTSIMTVEEKCIYRPSTDNSEWTECHREAWINSSVYGFSYALQKFGVERFKSNVSKSFKGLNFTLNRLFPFVDAHAVIHSASSAVTLRNTAKTAHDLAKSVVATN